MRVLLALASVCALATVVPVACSAAPVKSPDASGRRAAKARPIVEPPMQVSLVRSATPGCEPHCQEWIMAQGRIEPSSLMKLKKALSNAGNRQLPVLIHSGGGDVDQSLAMGRLIRAKGLTIAVAKTEIAPCDPKDRDCLKAASNGSLRGRAIGHHSVCASACAFLLAGGVHRLIGPRPLVGVHQVTSFETRIKLLRTYRLETRTGFLGIPIGTKKTLVSEKRISEKTVEKKTSDSKYEKIAKYFAEMGVDKSIMPMIMSANPKSVHILTEGELRTTRLQTEAFDGEHLIAGRASAAASKDAGSAAEEAATPYDPSKVMGPCNGSPRNRLACTE